MTSRRSLLKYWPTDEEVRACIMADAESADNAVLLAVHQPMRFDRRTIGADAAVESCNEEELFQAFVSPNPMDGRIILPIVGTSGTGKSHVIRWLDARLKRAPGADGRVVIRIPKGTSLKAVLDILLSSLASSAYDEYRKELQRAKQSLDTNEAAGLLCETLAYMLSEMGAAASAALTKNPRDLEASERAAFCSAQMLPGLLRNQFLRDHHFVTGPSGQEGVISRLVEQLTVTKSGTESSSSRHVFMPDDLIFDDSIDSTVLGRDVARAVTSLSRLDRREAACRFLNEALDGAKQRLLNLDPTISDLFNAVRAELLKEGRELVLLVEDFADLSGLQKQLLQIVIKEAYRDGRQVLCTMRTALAYTTGYVTAETVLTRAHHEFHIPDTAGSDEEMLDRIERLVGAYLNAARLGKPVLQRAYKASDPTADAATAVPNGWVPRFSSLVEDDVTATLHAFGHSADGFELFPFNAAAIHELSREGSNKGGRLTYNPRYVIQSVLNRVLSQRDLFAKGAFPSSSFAKASKPLPARVSEELQRRVPGSLDRYLAFFTYWGGFPGTIQEAAGVSPRLMSAFMLDPIKFADVATPESRPQRVAPAVAKTIVPAPTSGASIAADPIETDWEQRLEAWRSGETLAQVKANELRKLIAEALQSFIEFNWYNYRPLKETAVSSWFEWIYIPKAGGNHGRSAESSMTALCRDDDLSNRSLSAELQNQLMALIRFHRVHKQSWDYPGADFDLPAYSALLERLAPPTQAFVRARYFRPPLDPVPSLVDGLLIGARALGIDTARSDHDRPALIASLFADAAVPEEANRSSPKHAGWNEFTRALLKCRTGSRGPQDAGSWADHLLDNIGARQGNADTVHAIDVTTLMDALQLVVTSWEFRATLPQQAGAEAYAAFRSLYSELKSASQAIESTRKEMLRWHDETVTWLGTNFEKEETIREMKELFDEARAAGLGANVDLAAAGRLAESLRTSRLAPALEDGRRLLADSSRGTALLVLGADHFAVTHLVDQLRAATDDVIQHLTARLEGETRTFGSDPVGEAKGLLSTELSDIANLLESVTKS